MTSKIEETKPSKISKGARKTQKLLKSAGYVLKRSVKASSHDVWHHPVTGHHQTVSRQTNNDNEIQRVKSQIKKGARGTQNKN